MNGDSNQRKVLICDGLNREGIELLGATRGIEVDDRTGIDRESLERDIHEYHGVIVRSRTKVDETLLSLGKNIQVVGRAGT